MAAATQAAAAQQQQQHPAAVPPDVLAQEDISPPTARWLRLFATTCRAADGREFTWEWVERRSKYQASDGAAVFARAVSAGQPDRLVVIAQWRPPVQKFVLELPAGIIEQGESLQALATRELKEETGFVGDVSRVTTEATNDQGLTNSCLNFAFATVDLSHPANLDPQPAPELGETIQVLLLPLQGLAGELERLKAERGWSIDSRLLAFALGLEFTHSAVK